MFRSLASNRRLPRPLAVLLSVALAVFFIPFTLMGTAQAVTVGGFEIEGNLVDDPAAGIDWASLSPGDAGLATDVDHTVGGQDSTTFGGGSKEYADGQNNGWPSWVYGGGNAPGKSDFGRWAVYTHTENGNVWLDLGFDRDAAQGTAKYAFELNQVTQSVTTNPNPVRSQGDLRFIVWDQGNGTITLTGDASNSDVGLYRWVDPDQAAAGVAVDTDHDGHWVKNNTNGTFVGAVNNTTVAVPSWWTSANVTNGGLVADTFVEFALNLTSFGAVLGCPSSGFSAVNARSITGTGTTGALVDYLAALPVTIPSTCTSLVTHATAQATIGSSITDTATVTPSSAQGTVTFKVYGPNDATCANAPVATLGPVTVSGGSATSPAYTPTSVATYRWIASYTSSDTTQWANSVGKCNDANENSVIVKKQPAISTTAQASATLPNASIHDTANLTSLTPDATGTVTFNLFAPGDTTCATSIWTNAQALGTVTAGGAASVQSDDHVVTVAGTYRWIASYGGDGKNLAVSGQCNDANEATVVNKAVATITTSASATATLPDATVSDTATLGGVTATAGGSIVFRLYGPDATPGTPTCIDSGTGANLVFTSAPVAVSGPGGYGPVSTTVDVAGTYFWVASYSGDANNLSVSGVCGESGETSAVDKASPAITTSATGANAPGGQVHDTANLTGLSKNPTGTVTFNLYGPSAAPDCSGSAIFTSTVSIVPGATGTATATSGNATLANAGSYYWTATYNGDANNAVAVSGCGAPNEMSSVGKAHPQIGTQATSTSLPAGTIHDVATVSGLSANATGTVTFNLYGPSAQPDCSGAAKMTETKGIGTVTSGTAVVTSSSYTPTAAGNYYWTASYSGDANNDPIAGACGDSGETSTVSPATPAITTTATATASLPTGTLTDSAHLTGLTSTATGTVVFRLYGPDATPGTPSCDSPLVYTSALVAITNNGDGTADAATPAPGFMPVVAGTYFWVASYSGDANDSPIAGACGADGETSVVTKASPGISTVATDSAQLPAGTIHDVATVTGLSSTASGTVTFNLYGPSAQPDCSGAVTFTDTEPLGTVTSGVASATSTSYTPTAAGTYYWIASYSGDANNNAKAGTCGDTGETSTVAPASPGIDTQVDDAIMTLVPGGVALGDTAHLTGATADAGGTITFRLSGPFGGPEDISCESGTVIGSVAVTGSGTYVSPTTTVSAAGYYTWVASYSGDANNDAVSHPCGLESETVVLQKAPTEVATVAAESAIIKLGDTINDQAFVSGVTEDATGTVTFSLYGPDNADCSGQAIFNSMVDMVVGTLDGKFVGTATSGDFTPTQAGVYRWVASYSGDDNNTSSAGVCNDPNEQSQVFAGDHPGLNKDSDPAPGSIVQPGQQIDYSVTVSNTGDVAITDAPVVDILPAHVTPILASISDGGVYDAAAGTITWKVTLGPDGSADPASSHTFTYSVTVDQDAPSGSILTNTARFQGIEDTTTHVVATGGLGIVKAVSPVAGNGVVVHFGDTLTYTLTVTSSGTLNQQDVLVTDYVPGHDPARPTSGTTTYVTGSAACDATCTIDQPGADGLITWHLGDMAAGTTRTVTFKVTIDRPAANADGSTPAVDVLNAGAVESVRVPHTPSNEVKTPVSEVLPVKQGRPLPRTGLGLPVGPAVGGALALIGAGMLLFAAARRRDDEDGRHHA